MLSGASDAAADHLVMGIHDRFFACLHRRPNSKKLFPINVAETKGLTSQILKAFSCVDIDGRRGNDDDNVEDDNDDYSDNNNNDHRRHFLSLVDDTMLMWLPCYTAV